VTLGSLLPGSAIRAHGRGVAAASTILRAQQENLSHNERLDTLTLRALKRNVPSLDVANSLVSATVSLTITGASQLTIGIHDPKGRLERSGFFDRDDNGRLDSISMMLDGLRFRLVKTARDGTTYSLTFEDEVWALLRAHRKHISSSRNALTRAQFIERMVREVKLRDIPYYAPEKGRKQPVKAPDFPDTKPSGGSSGFDQGTKFTIAGSRADPQQMREVATAMGVADQEDVAQESIVRLAMLVAGIGESGFRNIPNAGGSPYGGVFQALKTRHMSTEEQARAFLKGGQGFQAGGAIAAHRSNPGWSPGTIAYHVEGDRSNFGSDAAAEHFYQQHHDEAAKIASLWNGGDGGASTHEAVRVKSYRFTRGQPGQTENTVQCATRLADEVKWRFFSVGGIVYFTSDYELISHAADLVFDGFDAPGLLALPSYEWDHRKLYGECTLTVSANAWGVRPGSVVKLQSMGSIDGAWIVETFDFDLFNSKVATVTLVKPTKPAKEPAPELFTVAVGDGAPGGGSSGGGGSGGAADAVAWARGRIGHYAESMGWNRGAELDDLERKFGMVGQPWCAIFATTAVVMGGASRQVRTAAVAQINQWASEGSHGYQRGSRATPLPGDLITFGNDHVGLVEKVSGNSINTIEGNTSAGKVARVTRLKGSGRIVRPDYPE
jgi:CHAP domain